MECISTLLPKALLDFENNSRKRNATTTMILPYLKEFSEKLEYVGYQYPISSLQVKQNKDKQGAVRVRKTTSTSYPVIFMWKKLKKRENGIDVGIKERKTYGQSITEWDRNEFKSPKIKEKSKKQHILQCITTS